MWPKIPHASKKLSCTYKVNQPKSYGEMVGWGPFNPVRHPPFPMSLSLPKFQANKVVPVALLGEPSDAFDGWCCWDRKFACCCGCGEFMTSCLEATKMGGNISKTFRWWMVSHQHMYTMGPPKPTFLEVFMVNNPAFLGGPPQTLNIFQWVVGGKNDIYIYMTWLTPQPTHRLQPTNHPTTSRRHPQGLPVTKQTAILEGQHISRGQGQGFCQGHQTCQSLKEWWNPTVPPQWSCWRWWSRWGGGILPGWSWMEIFSRGGFSPFLFGGWYIYRFIHIYNVYIYIYICRSEDFFGLGVSGNPLLNNFV